MISKSSHSHGSLSQDSNAAPPGLAPFCRQDSPFTFPIGLRCTSFPADTTCWVPHPRCDLCLCPAGLLTLAFQPLPLIGPVPCPPGPSPCQVPDPGSLIPTLFSGFSTFKHLWKQVAQNLDRFRTFPRLAGGKGPSPWGPRDLSLPCHHKRGGGDAAIGGAALQELRPGGP